MNKELENKIEELIKKHKPDLENETLNIISSMIYDSITDEEGNSTDENLEYLVIMFLDNAFNNTNIEDIIVYEQTKKDLGKVYIKNILETNKVINYLRLTIIFSLYVKVLRLKQLKLQFKLHRFDVDDVFNDLYNNLYQLIDYLKNDKIIFKKIKKYLIVLKKYNNIDCIFEIYDILNKLKHKYMELDNYVNYKIDSTINYIEGINYVSNNHTSEKFLSYDDSINEECVKLGLK